MSPGIRPFVASPTSRFGRFLPVPYRIQRRLVVCCAKPATWRRTLRTYSARNDLLLGHSDGNQGAGSDTAARPISDQRKGTKPPENLPAGRRPPERDSALTLCFFSRTFDRGVISSIFLSRASVAPTIPLAWVPKNIGRFRLFLAKSLAESTSQHSTFASELAPIGGPLNR